MRRTRSRPKTEEKFIHAVASIIGESGFSNLGINNIAQVAGVDKVLIYRYFNGVDGLLERVAASREWLPQLETIIELIGPDRSSSEKILQSIHQTMTKAVCMEPTTISLLRWGNATVNPLTNYFTKHWETFWEDLATHLCQGAIRESREAWQHACLLLKFATKESICGQQLPKDFFEQLSNNLSPLNEDPVQPSTTMDIEHLPTNLL